MRTIIVSLLLGIAGIAAASDPRAWRLAKVTTASRDGLTQFQVLHINDHGGRVRILRSARDASCPGGASYEIGWHVEGDTTRVVPGQTLTVSFNGEQTGGADCPNGEPNARAGTAQGAIDAGWGPGSYTWFSGPSGHEFYVHPARGRERHQSQFTVKLADNVYQPHQMLVIQIDTSGNSGGQWFNAAWLYDAETAPATTGELENGVARHGGDYRNFDLPSGNPADCRAACVADPQCRAFTMSGPGIIGPNPQCWLKNSVGPQHPKPGCTSGVVPGR